MPGSASHPTIASLQAENAELRARLEEAEETVRAIREGEVDAVIVSGSQGDRVFSLMETENLHRLMVETMNEAGLAISTDGLLLYCNECAATLLKRPRNRLLGRRLDEFVAPRDLRRLHAVLATSPRETADDRVVFLAADGEEVPLHLWASRLDRPEEPLICLVGTDLTRLEADRALVAQLEKQQRAIFASRAEALELMAEAVEAREQAAQSARELQESDQRKDAFLATLAHELRNPLAAILNALEILRQSDVRDPLANRAREVMERQFAHLARLVDDLLEVSRITRGKIALRREPVELATIIDSAVETVRPLIDAAQQRLRVKLPRQPLWLGADQMRLAQVFGNLLNNATKYTGAGGEIRLDVRRQNGAVRVTVRDTGVGIPADLLPRVFDLFQQGDPDQLRVHGGLGIGLSLVRSLVELHDGWVEARSAGPGQGSELVVSLPLAKGRMRTSQRPAKPAPPRLRDGVGLSPDCRILVVDDNRDAANSLAALLELKGGAVHVAYDGPSALAVMDELRPNLAILDLGMPGMDGHEVARRIRARPECRETTLIAMTGRCQETDRQGSLDAGFDHHLVKPVPLDVLDALLLAFQDRPSGDSELSGIARIACPESSGPAPRQRFATLIRALEQEQETDTERDRQADAMEPIFAALIHDLAQPLNTVGCYAVAARNLAIKSGGDPARLCEALRGIDQQIQLAGTAMDRLRERFRGRALPFAGHSSDDGMDVARND
ncbi:ATP-binding protein [Thiocystis violascens]|uniref:histidine kinase n=1 Tax=Thiocystis violascens (strain ATCC 17096 / DSM 198 / 6111) TaxID=765911 RepID=I3Y5U0_THIV6|nr:ATP-binding protein [Thiocystis violascens]AFL72358.1 PAS domain S-box [Thiocystis violascens DSM 198]